MVTIQGQFSLVGAQLLTPPRPIDSQTGEYATDYSVDEWKALWQERHAEFANTQQNARNNLSDWLDDNADANVTRAYYLDGQLTAVFGSNNANISNGMDYGFEYRVAKNAGEQQGLTGDKLTEFVENRVETELKRKYGDRLTVKDGPAGTLGTLGDYRDELFGGDRWPSAENLPKQPAIDWDAPSPAQAGTWQGPLAPIDTEAFLGIRKLALENQ